MGAAREPGPADFDLERFIDMFDEALTSQDERVVNALRSLMMMTILTKSEIRNPMADRNTGPLRQMYEDLNNIIRRVNRMEDELRQVKDASSGNMKYGNNWPSSVTASKFVWDTSNEDDFKRHLKDEYYRIMNQTGKL